MVCGIDVSEGYVIISKDYTKQGSVNDEGSTKDKGSSK